MRNLWISMAVFLVMAVVGYYAKRSEAPKSFDQHMMAIAADTVTLSKKQYGVDLDYTPASIEKVESILGKIHDENAKKPVDSEELWAAAMCWGAYVGEVIKRVKPDAHWERDSKVGKDSDPLVLGKDHEAFPCTWCLKRIVNGPEDNIVTKFRIMILEEAGKLPPLAGGTNSAIRTDKPAEHPAALQD